MRHSSGRREPRLRARRIEQPSGPGAPSDNLLTESEGQALLACSSVVNYGKGQPVYGFGEDAQFLYIIDRGIVRVSFDLKDGERQVLGFMWPGDIIGLAEEGRYVSSADCLTKTTLYRMSLVDLRRILVDDPFLQLHFLTKAAHELRRAQRQIIVLGRLDRARRLAAFLTDCAHHLGTPGTGSVDMRLPMTRFDIADYLGLTPESVTRAFVALEERGLVRRKGPRSIEILAPEGLRRFSRVLLYGQE